MQLICICPPTDIFVPAVRRHCASGVFFIQYIFCLKDSIDVTAQQHLMYHGFCYIFIAVRIVVTVKINYSSLSEP